uniref:ORF2 n=1 Tax=Torque teno sus virus 1a TaxID=687386 RepID=G3FE04_9VIRU|nr:ORF2 [Torque teno sus virus 1a]
MAVAPRRWSRTRFGRRQLRRHYSGKRRYGWRRRYYRYRPRIYYRRRWLVNQGSETMAGKEKAAFRLPTRWT